MSWQGGEARAIDEVTPLALHAYLVAHGWRKGEPFGDESDVYSLGIDSGAEIVAPGTTTFADYSRRIAQIIKICANIEQRPEPAVLRDLSLADVDLIRVRVRAAKDDGSIPMHSGVVLLTESRQLLLAAACSTTGPQRSYRTGRNRQASDYLETVRLGQTEQGSYVVSLLSPVSPALVDDGQVEFWPFARRVTKMLFTGLDAARDAVILVNRGGGIEVFEQRLEAGVSANLCAAAAHLIDEGDGLDVSISWALTHAPSEPASVRFEPSDADVLSAAARVLTSRQERIDERIQGYVSTLAREQSKYEGRATIKGFIDGTLTSVKADFDPADYTRIVEAHDQRRAVSLEGELRREGQRWFLRNPRDLHVMIDDDDERNE